MPRRVRVRWFRGNRDRSGGAGEAPRRAPRVGEEGFDPLSDLREPDPGLSPAERREAEEEARQGVPSPAATGPSPGERRLEGRFRKALAAIRTRADQVLADLGAALHAARTEALGVEAEAARERDRAAALAAVGPACQRLEAHFRRARTAEEELAGFRRERGLPDYATPRPGGRGWIWLLLAVALAETTANGLLLHSASTEGAVSNWLFAGLVTAMNVGLLGFVIGDLIFRRMLRAGALRRTLLATALAPCLLVAGLLHFGFAHYRDATSALAEARAEAAFDLGDIDAGASGEGSVPDPHPPPTLSVEEAVIGELRAQFLWWRPGARLVEHPSDLPPDDHSLDSVRDLPAGSVGYRAAGGTLVLVEDPMAGRFEGWRSVLLLTVGWVALLLSAWKWFGGREPLPHFERLHRARDEAARALDAAYEQALATLNEHERLHGERLGDAETGILALGPRLASLDASWSQTVAREEEFVRRTRTAAASAIEEFREWNRQHRLSQDPPPDFWSEPPQLDHPARSEDARSAWDRDRGQGLIEIGETAERVRSANLAHAPEAAALFEEARERIAQAARIRGARRRPPSPHGDGPPPGGKDLRFAVRAPSTARRLEIAS